MRFLIFLAAALLILPAYAHADDRSFSILDLPEGHSLLTLSATESKAVQEDLLQARLRIEIEGQDPGAVQEKINKIMEDALALTEGKDSVKTSTEEYHIYQRRKGNSAREVIVWRGQQGIMLSGKDPAPILKLVTKMQEDLGMTINRLSYILSADKADSVRDSLMEAALSQLKAKADRAAKALGKSAAELLDISIGHSQGGDELYPRLESARLMAADSAPANAAAGEQRISLTVSAKALLKP